MHPELQGHSGSANHHQHYKFLSLPSKRSEHWRRLWDWLFCPSMCVSIIRCVHLFVYMMTNYSNDVIALTAQAAMLAITLTSFLCSEAALCLHHVTWRRYALLRAPSSYHYVCQVVAPYSTQDCSYLATTKNPSISILDPDAETYHYHHHHHQNLITYKLRQAQPS